MKEIYLEIDGKRIKLSEEQVKLLNLEKQENKNPFGKVNWSNKYYAIDKRGKVLTYCQENDIVDKTLDIVANNFNDENFAIRQAKSEVLNRLLKRFSYENGWSDDKFFMKETQKEKYFIFYNINTNAYDISFNRGSTILGIVYFATAEIAQRAIDEIIIPFEQGKLEVCKIWE